MEKEITGKLNIAETGTERGVAEQTLGPGSRVGRLTIVSDSGERKNGYIVWNCRCDCGNEIRVDRRRLMRRTVLDCGCETKMRPGQRDITGERFGMLTVRYCTGEKDSGGSYYWHCACDCGGEVDASLHQLQAGYRKSCGCLSRTKPEEFIGKRFGHLTVIALADRKDGMNRWRCRCDCGRETVVWQRLLRSGRTKSCGCVRASANRKSLKLVDGTSVTILERNRNQLVRTNTSGKAGVYYNQKIGRWVAQLGFRGKRIYLGSYLDREEAVKARIRAEATVNDFLANYYDDRLLADSTGLTNKIATLIGKMEEKS